MYPMTMHQFNKALRHSPKLVFFSNAYKLMSIFQQNGVWNILEVKVIAYSLHRNKDVFISNYEDCSPLFRAENQKRQRFLKNYCWNSYHTSKLNKIFYGKIVSSSISTRFYRSTIDRIILYIFVV